MAPTKLSSTVAERARAATGKAQDHPISPPVAETIVIEIAAKSHEPHRIAFYLYELASAFHALWNRGNKEEDLRFVQEGDAETSRAKIALARSVAVVISAGLGILGVTPVKEMR